MSKSVSIALAAIAVVALGGAAWFFSQGGAEPTTDVTAPAIDPTTTVDASPTTTPASETSTTTTEATRTATLFEITEDSTATFVLDEELRGEPTTVRGTSDIVLGQIELDRTDLAETRIGTILVNARAFATDSSLRDRAVRGPILDTDAFEFIEFTPTTIEGLSGEASIGDELSFTVTGDLTIRGITDEVTFDVSATLVDDSTISGNAVTTVTRDAFELAIPSVPTVANVSDEVMLELSFTASS